MISGARTRLIRINITTYKNQEHTEDEMEERTNKKYCNKAYHNKFVCAICLNPKVEDRNCECCKKVSKSCPICQNTKECCGKVKEKERRVAEKETFCVMRNKTRDYRDKSPVTRDRIIDCSGNIKGRVIEQEKIRREPIAKTVQTSDTNVAQGLSLLNEVLTVFQNKKVDINKEKVKSGLLRDVAVSTADEVDEKTQKDKSKLSVSTFQYSIDDKKNIIENGKFTVMNCCQPVYLKAQNSLDLLKHKSSSIPQMKLEELKYSLKEKSRSKDAIEEVNRMFATVRKGGKFTENSNRPMVRSGPRVLPVVKTPDQNKKDFGTEQSEIYSCKCCQTNMSSGDSFVKPQCGHGSDKVKCDKCVYMLCCHYEKAHKMQTGVLMCEHCRVLNDECCQNCVDDSG
ncbi:hypothetical protein PYW07_011794 [Mythimna separata]|uniref:Uncharacterized protein n=1 Tax=Mythimna separata TaxID=271217 RepID=A0AAD8DKQ5_MYTSE|nr:hypothetical protein PYW07_011794 [Mythimna separata]